MPDDAPQTTRRAVIATAGAALGGGMLVAPATAHDHGDRRLGENSKTEAQDLTLGRMRVGERDGDQIVEVELTNHDTWRWHATVTVEIYESAPGDRDGVGGDLDYLTTVRWSLWGIGGGTQTLRKRVPDDADSFLNPRVETGWW